MRRFLRFRLRTLFLLVAILALALRYSPRATPLSYPAGFGLVQMNQTWTFDDRDVNVHVSGKLTTWAISKTAKSYGEAAIGNQIVVVVSDVSKITRAKAKEFLKHPNCDGLKCGVHFIELVSSSNAKMRSFGGYWITEQQESLAGALASIHVLQQLSFRLPDFTVGDLDNPIKIEFASGSILRACYMTHWGDGYLRQVKGPKHLTERLKVMPYSENEIRRFEKRLKEKEERESKAPLAR